MEALLLGPHYSLTSLTSQSHLKTDTTLLVYCRGKKNSKSHHQTEFLENKIKHATKNSVNTKQYKNKLRHKWLSVLSL